MEDAYIINGGKPLVGKVQISGAKNIALKVLIVSLMFEGPVRLINIPRIKDILELMQLINCLGGKADFVGENEVEVDGRGIDVSEIDLLYASKIRVSFMLFAPLLYRLNKANIPNPGGCRIGARSIDRSIDLMKKFGVEVDYNEETGFYNSKADYKNLKSVEYIFAKPSHTGTELAIFFAILVAGETRIKNASLEPEIDDLICFLNQSGAKICRQGNDIVISGVNKLKNHSTYKIAYDRNEAVTYAVLAIASRGDITICGATHKDLEFFLKQLDIVGGGYEIIDEEKIRFFYKGDLKPSNVTTMPHPGFMTDWQAPWAVLMTQSTGESTIHETIFENRFGYVEELRKLGAEMNFFHPIVDNPKNLYQFFVGNYSQLRQAITISGKADLHNGVMTVSDLRAGACLIIAACIANGESIIYGASTIDRGYEDLDKKLRILGGNVERI